MEINNFLSLTNKKIQADVLNKLKVESASEDSTAFATKSEADSLIINGKEIDMFGNISDEQILSRYAVTLQKMDPIMDFNDEPIILDDGSDNNSDSNVITDTDDTSSEVTGSENTDNIDEVTGTVETSNTESPKTNNITSATQGYNPIVAGMTEAEIKDIKAKIYAIHNTKTKFNDSFDSADTLFDYLSTISNGEITKETGILKEQLTKFTQNDKWEDEHNDFFGSLNRAFSNVKPNEYISYYQIRHLFYTAAGNDLEVNLSEFQTNVETFAQKVQKEFESLGSDEAKLEFLLSKTEEYLYAAGLEDQLAALYRLIGADEKANNSDTAPGDDTHNDIHIGQIAIADLPGSQLGGYSSWSLRQNLYEYNGVQYNTSIWFGDEDDTDYPNTDMGLTIDSSYLDKEWYLGVNALVHELTHATAFLYYEDMYNNGTYTQKDGDIEYFYPGAEIIDKIYAKGMLSDSEYQTLKSITNENEMANHKALMNKLQYLLKTAWGEYAAYQADADYIDSIAGDIFDSDKDGFEMAVSGEQEQNTIHNHIAEQYNTYNLNPEDEDYHMEAKPTNDWWITYKDTEDWSTYI